MTIGSILLGLALLIVVGLILSKPLLTAGPQSTQSLDKRRQLELRKEAFLAEIRRLDFDHETGNIPTDVYELQRTQLMNEAAVVLREMDELPAAAGEDIQAQIEAAVLQRRDHRAPSSNGQAGFCTQCGQPLDADDKFCARCGQPLRVAQPTTGRV
jgi:NADH pyrophosphatase NudC (nudix superfamily)